MAVTPGKTIADLRQESQLKDVRSNGTNGGASQSDSPLKGARATMNELLATKVISQAAAEMDVQAAELDARKADAELKRQQAVEALRNRGQDGGSEMVGMMMAELKETRDRLESLRDTMTAREIQVHQERLAAISEELARMREQAGQAVQSTPPGFVELKTQIEAALAITQLLRPTEEVRPAAVPPPLPPGEPSPARMEVWLARQKMEHERWLRERDEEREERHLRLEMEDRRERERILQEREDRMARERVFTDSLPKVLDLATNFAQAFLQKWQASPVPIGAEAPMVAAAQTAPTLPPGVVAHPCQQCGATMYVRPEWGSAICQSCGADHRWETGQAQDRHPVPAVPRPPASAPETSRGREDDDQGGPMG